MKTTRLLLGVSVFALVLASCTNDSSKADSPTAVTADNAVTTQKLDAAVSDVSFIAEDQFEAHEASTTAKSANVNYVSILPANVTISDLGSTATTRVLTITFGNATTSTFSFKGHNLKGQIILTYTIGTTFPRVMTITYNNFYVNDALLEGQTTWTRNMIGTGADAHPITTVNFTKTKLTLTDGVYTRAGEITREMIAGFSTRLDPSDDVHSTYGSFTTTFPNGNVFTSTIDVKTPLIHKTVCSFLDASDATKSFPVSGILTIAKEKHNVVIDYGNGDCDNLATISIDGGAATSFILGDKK